MWIEATHTKEDESTEQVHILDIKCKDDDMSNHTVVYAIDETGVIGTDADMTKFCVCE